MSEEKDQINYHSLGGIMAARPEVSKNKESRMLRQSIDMIKASIVEQNTKLGLLHRNVDQGSLQGGFMIGNKSVDEYDQFHISKRREEQLSKQPKVEKVMPDEHQIMSRKASIVEHDSYINENKEQEQLINKSKDKRQIYKSPSARE